MSYVLRVDLDEPFEEVVPKVKSALAANGFGIVSEIDMRKILQAKIGVEMDEQLILGACNPHFANRALQVEPSIGALLPCNVVVRRADGVTIVEMINTQTMVALTGNPAMTEFAAQVGAALQASMDALSAAA